MQFGRPPVFGDVVGFGDIAEADLVLRRHSCLGVDRSPDEAGCFAVLCRNAAGDAVSP